MYRTKNYIHVHVYVHACNDTTMSPWKVTADSIQLQLLQALDRNFAKLGLWNNMIIPVISNAVREVLYIHCIVHAVFVKNSKDLNPELFD